MSECSCHACQQDLTTAVRQGGTKEKPKSPWQTLDPDQRKDAIRVGVALLLFFVILLLPIDSMFPQPTALYVEFALFLVPYLLAGYEVLIGAAKGLVKGHVLDEDFLMSIATVGAFALVLFPDSDPHMAEGAAVMLFFQVGELFEGYAVAKSRRSIADMMDIAPEYANVRRDGQLVQVSPDQVQPGDVIVVKPGERVPLDGRILSGTTQLDTAALTGESVPRTAAPGDDCISGCVNLTGVIEVQVTKPFAQSTVQRILDLVENSAQKKARAESFITRFARYYTPVVVGAALLLAVIPPLLLGQSWSEWIQRGLIFLVVSCPCALVISVPLSFFGGIGGASRLGILIKGGNYLEALSKVDTVVFDKTGTLTSGSFEVIQVSPAEGVCPQDLLETAALAESYSDHPIALSVRRAFAHQAEAGEREGGENASCCCGSEPATACCCEPEPAAACCCGSDPAEAEPCCCGGHADEPASCCSESEARAADASPVASGAQERVADAHEESGHGVSALVDGARVLVGNAKLLAKHGVPVPDQAQQPAGTLLHVSRGGAYLGSLVVADSLKPDARQAVADLRAAGVSRTVMLSGDREQVAAAVAEDLGLDQYFAQLLPDQKVEHVERLLEGKPQGSTLAFVGDGINDAPVLMRADVGIAMGALGSDAAIEAADVVLMDDAPSKIAAAIRVARKTMGIVWQNIVFAIGVKVLIMVLAAVGIANLWLAVFGDVGVAVIAILNAMRAMRAAR